MLDDFAGVLMSCKTKGCQCCAGESTAIYNVSCRGEDSRIESRCYAEGWILLGRDNVSVIKLRIYLRNVGDSSTDLTRMTLSDQAFPLLCPLDCADCRCLNLYRGSLDSDPSILLSTPHPR